MYIDYLHVVEFAYNCYLTHDFVLFFLVSSFPLIIPTGKYAL